MIFHKKFHIEERLHYQETYKLWYNGTEVIVLRKLIILCVLALGISGCTKRSNSDQDFQYTYNSFVDSILDNNGVDTKDIPFSHKLEVTKETSGEYRYEITIDNPRVAMYNIQMMVVDKSASGEYPFIGLMSDEALYSMIPNQENKEKYFVKGIVLEGISSTPKFTLYVQVSWKDYAQINTRTVFFSYTYDYDKDHVEETTDEQKDSGNESGE